MVELHVASEQDIQDELRRREMVAKDEKIKTLLHEINIAYNTGGITNITKNTVNQGTSASATTYFVNTK